MSCALVIVLMMLMTVTGSCMSYGSLNEFSVVIHFVKSHRIGLNPVDLGNSSIAHLILSLKKINLIVWSDDRKMALMLIKCSRCL